MPPPISPGTGSRAGLITGLVVSVIIAVSMIVVSIFTAQKLSDSERALQDLRDRDKPFIVESDITDPRVLALNQLKADQPAYQGLPTAMQVSLAESDQLAKIVGGNTTPDRTIDAARGALNDAQKKIDAQKKFLTFSLPQDNLINAVKALTDQVVRLSAANQDVKNQLQAAQQQTQQVIASNKAELEAKDKLIADANAKAEQAVADAKKAQDDATQKNTDLQTSANADLKKTQDANAALTAQMQAKDKQQLLALQKADAGIKGKLKISRINTNEPIIQHPDGNIIRVTENNTCFINLGERQHVSKGLTFEVYDKTKGIPPLGDGLADTGLPVGKASIEVFSVGPDTSECRIIKVQPGQTIIIGDLISNLIYDPTVRYNFVVYGDFDLSGSGISSPTDAEIVKRLITQWGGKVQDHVDVDTDFVVMGTEPAVPPVADPNDPSGVLKHQQAVEKHQKYEAVITAAGEFSVPVMNQNRFLYFIGYYDQAGR